jgi:Flp pilus assembly protein TadD
MYKVIPFACIFLMLLTGCAHKVAPPFQKTSKADMPTTQSAEEALTLAHLLRDNGRYKAAFEVYQKMDENQELKGAYLLEYATMASFIIEPIDVIPLYHRARKALAGHETAEQREAICAGLGRAYLQTARRNKAQHYFTCALNVNPRNVTALNGTSVIAGLQGKANKARALLEKALDVDPNNTMVLNNLAMIHLLHSDYTQAIDLLRTQPQRLSMSGRLNLALAYILNQRSDEARVLLNRYLTKNKSEQIIARFEKIRQRIDKGHPISVEIAALTQTPVQLTEGE